MPSLAANDRSTPPGRLRLGTVLPFAAPSLGLSALGVAVFVYLPPYFAGHLKVPMALVGGVWMFVRLIDIPVDVLLAVVMDRTRSILGRYRLWMLMGAPVLMLAVWKLFMAPVGFSGGYLLSWLFVLYLGTSILGLAHSAWGATLATRYHERSFLFGVLNAVGVLGTMAALATVIAGKPLGLNDAQSVQAMGWLIIALLPVTVLLAAVRTPERIAPETPRSGFPLRDYWEVLRKPDLLRLFAAQLVLTLGPGWMSAIYLFFFRDARGFTTQQATVLLAAYILAQIPGSLLAAAVARRIGKHRTLMLAAAGFSLGLFTIFIIPRADLAATIPSMVWSGMTAAAFNLMIRAMLADVGDEIRLDQGKQRISLLYAVNGLAAKIAGAFSIGLTFPLLASLGYKAAEGAVNTPAAIHNLTLSFLLGPIVFVMLGGACVIGWRLDARRQDEVRHQLETRDAELEAGAAAWPLPHPPADPEIAA
jgi:Na+/melibiose symporter-like transporter